MRSLISRLALAGIVGAALSGCGTTSGSSLPAGSSLGNGGGGVVNVTQQNNPAGTIAGLLVDGGTKAYTGFNTTAADALPPTAPQKTDATGKTAPADSAGSHSIVYSGNGLVQQIFTYSGNPIDLVIPTSATTTTPGNILPVDYGAIVFFATPPSSAASLSIELTGGSGTTAYDVRIGCTATVLPTPSPSATPVPTPAPSATPLAPALMSRYVCTLPAYGAASSTGFANPVVSGSATGTFTPTAAKLYLVVNDSAPLAATSTANTLLLDYLYAEQGTS